jgi:hypothetical protein
MRLLLPIALAAGLVAAPAHAAGARDCGLTKRIDGSRYQVKEVRGSVSCATVKRVVSGFLRDGTVASHWDCFRGHDDVPWAASCARGKQVLVRVYAPT